jgi:hypothetical protein
MREEDLKYKIGDMLAISNNSQNLYLVVQIGGKGGTLGQPFWYELLPLSYDDHNETWWCHYIDESDLWGKIA